MCGFCGLYYNRELTEKEEELARKMGESITFRGPDSDSTLLRGHFTAAFRRLSIIDLEGGTQPFSIEDGAFGGVFNGEVYNYLELQKQLKEEGVSFSTNSEIEVMLRLYQREGASFVSRLRGMYAIAFYNREKKELFLARDRFGIKPLYYRKSAEGLTFASEAKAFFNEADFAGFDVNEEKLQQYFTFQYIPGNDTLTDGICHVPPASYLVCHPGEEPVVTRYFDPIFTPDSKTDFETKKQAVREVICESVKSHMLADVQVGSFLSSGIDSAIITSVASKLSPGIKAYTVAFGEKEYSEITEADAIARHLDVEHIKLVAGPEEFKRAFEKVVWHLDFPVADPSTVAIYLICERAAQDLKVVLSGEGSDELFGGYRVYDESRFSSRIYALPAFLKRFLAAVAHALPDSVRGKNLLLRGTTPLSERYVGNAFIFGEEEKREFLKTYREDRKFYDATREIYDAARHLSPMAQMQYVDLMTWLRGDILVKSDRLAMAHSLEIRVPFLDREVFEVAKTLCDKDKLSHHTTKYILREAFRDMVDEATVLRPKLGYPVPVRKWLRGEELYGFAREIFENSTADAFVSREYCLKLLDDHRDGKADNYRKLWTLMVFVTWYRLYVTEGGKISDKILSEMHPNLDRDRSKE
ncbi:MAG: asparagine synthase (glutamine-hydrolyzing) [Clostridia bacterium]|nr:asparagine synthase (glutamine-hydrolyzing) [Clostridia bacterium]